MCINFFLISCKTNSIKECFGLCDDPPPSNNPAYIDENDIDKWIGLVDNPTLKSVDFFAIDKCVKVVRSDGTLEKRCDGILNYDTNLIFVELKDRKKDWATDGMQQIETTIRVFTANHNIASYNVSACICNKKPFFPSSFITHIQKFKTNTGYKISFNPEIII